MLASHLSGIGEHAAAAWLRWRIAWELVNDERRSSEKKPRLDEAETELQAAMSALDPLDCLRCRADLSARYAHELVRVSTRDRAARKAAFERAVAETERSSGESPTLAAVLEEYAPRASAANNMTDRLPDTTPLFQRAMRIRERLTPRCPERALLLASYADSLLPGDPENGRVAREAWLLVQQTAPFTPEAVTVGGTYADWLSFHGDLIALEQVRRHVALATERSWPEFRPVTQAFSDLAEILTLRGKRRGGEDSAPRSATSQAHGRNLSGI